MEVVGRVTTVSRAPNARWDFHLERGSVLGMGLESQPCTLSRASMARKRAGGPLFLVARRASSGGTNKQREERKYKEEIPSIPPPSPPPPPPSPVSSNSAELRAEDGDAEERGETSGEIGAGGGGLQSAEEEQEDIGKALSELRKRAADAGLQDSAGTADFWKGVAQETQLIEWPVFSKVLGTTGVVMAMILGSSVVLLTVNAILAAGSDYVFNDPAIREFFKTNLKLAF